MEAKAEVIEQFRTHSKGHWFTGSADRIVERTHQLPDDPPQVPRKGSRFSSRVDHDGQ